MERFRKHITHVSNIRDAATPQNEPTRPQKLHDFVYMASSYPFAIFSSPNPEIYLLLSISIHSQSTFIPLLVPHHRYQALKLLLGFPNAIRLPISSLLTLSHHAHRAPLDHQTHDLKQRICCRHGRMLGIGVVRRCDFDDIGRDEVDAFEPADDSTEFAGAPAASFRGSCCGSD